MEILRHHQDQFAGDRQRRQCALIPVAGGVGEVLQGKALAALQRRALQPGAGPGDGDGHPQTGQGGAVLAHLAGQFHQLCRPGGGKGVGAQFPAAPDSAGGQRDLVALVNGVVWPEKTIGQPVIPALQAPGGQQYRHGQECTGSGQGGGTVGVKFVQSLPHLRRVPHGVHCPLGGLLRRDAPLSESLNVVIQMVPQLSIGLLFAQFGADMGAHRVTVSFQYKERHRASPHFHP